MARKRKLVAPEVVRPTLEDVKAKTGKYVVVSYRGHESGGILIPPPDAYEAGLPLGYVPKDLLIEPWQWTVIPAYWLDDGRFARLYDATPGLMVDKVDQIPTRENLMTLPEDLAKRESLTRERVQKAWWIATQPYYPDAKAGDPRRATADVIQMNNMETGLDSPDQVDFLQGELAPILEAALIFEQRLGNRQNLINDIEKRLDEISGKKPYRRTRTPRQIYT
jgi:hypothetical protein